MTIELTERALYLIIKALMYKMVATKNDDMFLELDNIIQDLQFQREIE